MSKADDYVASITSLEAQIKKAMEAKPVMTSAGDEPEKGDVTTICEVTKDGGLRFLTDSLTKEQVINLGHFIQETYGEK